MLRLEVSLTKMPISSFHGLRKNSVPANSWNSTRTSVQRTPSCNNQTSNNTRKRHFGVPRLWDNEYDDGFAIDREEGDVRNSKGYPDVSRISRKLSASSRPRSARLADRGLKRRDTFPRFAGEIGAPHMEGKDFKRSKSDPSIAAEKKRRKNIAKSSKRPSSLWTASKRGENYSSTFRKRKVS